MGDISQRVGNRLTVRIKKAAMKVYTWDENSDSVSEFEVSDELASDMQAISSNIDEQVEGATIEEDMERSTITDVVETNGDRVGLGYYGRLFMFLVTGPTAQQTSQMLLDAVASKSDELDSEDAVREALGQVQTSTYGN